MDNAAKERRKAERVKETAWWARFRIIVLSLLLAGSVGSWLIFAEENENDERGAVVEMRALFVQEHYPRALEVAREWRNDVILEDADVWFRPVEQEGKLRASYSFRSPAEPEVWLLVWVYEDPGGGERIEQEEGIFETDRPVGDPIDPLQLPFDSVQALDIILRYGGEKFLAEHKHQAWPLSLHLERRLPRGQGPIVWRGSFMDVCALVSEHIRIDAFTAKPVE